MTRSWNSEKHIRCEKSIFAAGIAVMVASASQVFADGAEESVGIEEIDLVIALQGYNLTDDARDSFYGNPAQRGQYRKFGRNYELAVAYKF